MRIWVSGPHAGPVRTTIWSSSSHRGSGKGCAIIMLPFAAILLWVAVRTVAGAVIIGLFTVAVIGGFRQEHRRRERAAPAVQAPPPAPAQPESPAKVSNRR